MSIIKLYIATSLDGKIARLNGDVDWLDKIPHPPNEDYGYNAFYESIGITLMGNNTYKKVLSFGVEFPYKGKTNYVFTKDKIVEKDENVTYVSGDILSFVRQLKEDSEKDIWLIGGGEITALFLDHQLVDELIVFIMPVVLGEGIPLLGALKEDIPLVLKNRKIWEESGVVELVYGRALAATANN